MAQPVAHPMKWTRESQPYGEVADDPVESCLRELGESTNTVIAGSYALWEYMLQCGLSPKWTPGDIDVWVLGCPHKDEFNARVDVLTNRMESQRLSIEPVLDRRMAVRDFIIDEGLRISFIAGGNIPTAREVLDIFDLDIVQVGMHVDRQGVRKFLLGDRALRAIHSRSATMMTQPRVPESVRVARVKKYRSRGFSVTMSEEEVSNDYFKHLYKLYAGKK